MLPNEVINVLIHYLLVVQDSSTILKEHLKKNCCWLDKKNKNAQEAMTYVKSFTRENHYNAKRQKDSKGIKVNVIVKEITWMG